MCQKSYCNTLMNSNSKLSLFSNSKYSKPTVHPNIREHFWWCWVEFLNFSYFFGSKSLFFSKYVKKQGILLMFFGISMELSFKWGVTLRVFEKLILSLILRSLGIWGTSSGLGRRAYMASDSNLNCKNVVY